MTPKYSVGDTLKSGDYSFKVVEIEEDLEGKPVYVDTAEQCFCENECKRTRKAA